MAKSKPRFYTTEKTVDQRIGQLLELLRKYKEVLGGYTVVRDGKTVGDLLREGSSENLLTAGG